MEKRLQLWSPVWGWLATKEGESVDLKGQDLVLYESLCMMAEDGTKEIGLCRFVDEKQVDVNGQVWEIGEFLWQMERRGIQVYPLETAEKKKR